MKILAIHAPLQPDLLVEEVDFLGVRGEEDLEDSLLDVRFSMFDFWKTEHRIISEHQKSTIKHRNKNAVQKIKYIPH